MKTNHFIIYLLLFASSFGYSQQDAQYTQYMYNTININPAYAGSRDVLSIFGMYRTQWVGLEGAPDTGVFSLHSPVGERIGLGLTVVGDRIGVAKENTVSVDFSYTIPVSDNYKLAFGLKATAHMLDVDYSMLTVTPGDYVFQNNIENKFSPNFGAGVYLYSDKFYAGFSVPNILETEHFDDNIKSTPSERMHGYLITGYVFDLADNIQFKPAALAKAVNGAPLQLDVTGNFWFNEKLTLGVAWRWSAAVSALAGFQIDKNWFIGYAYDAETTKLANYNSGSHEIFLRYELFNKSKRIVSPRNSSNRKTNYMKKIIYISILLLGGLTISNAQKTQVKRADKEYNNLNYIDAIETYKKVANKGYKSVDMLEKLGNSYYFNAEYVDAAKWYAELFALKPEATDAEYYYRYSQSLKSVGDYKKAREYMDKFNKANGADDRAKLFVSEKNYLQVIEENSGRFTIENAGDLNSELSDYGTTIYNGEVIFASTRKAGKIAPRTQGWNDQPFSALYSSKADEDGKQQSAKFFSDKLDSKFNEATPVFTKDGNTIYFTRNNYLKKRGFDDERITLLKIYRATQKDGKWTDITELPFNSNDYNVAHPALSSDEKWLYFASDMPGTLGDADIWKVAINADGTFGTPINLGSKVNTEGRESFPFVTSENELYYASTGKQGLGGMDVFVSKITGNSYDEAINVGKPINTPMDDFAFYFDPTTRTGFLSSNREGGKGYDDIYKFTELKKLICEHLLAGTVTDVETGKILADAKVSLFDQNNKLIATTVSDKNGKYSFGKEYVKCDTSYRVRAEKEKYSTEEKYIKTPKSTGETMVDIALKQTKVEIEEGMDLAKTLNIPIIYFDLDKSNIRPDAAIEIAKVLQVMQDYPTMKIDIRSHTDCRQTYEYNMRLSDRRAKSTRHWLINKGISASRLTAKGYGETQLVNNCPCEPTNKSDCSEAEHQLNRRSEFIVVSK